MVPADEVLAPHTRKAPLYMSSSSSTQPASAPWLRVLIVGAALVTVTFGIRQVFGLFVVPMSVTLDTGVQMIALAIAVQNLIWGFSSPFLSLIHI